jgi:hypothetical protein
MPNWVSTTASVTGSKEELQRFISGITDKGILESYVPCPTELRETVSGFFGDEAKAEEIRKKNEDNIAKYGHKDWYDWQYEEWGTKWGDCDTHLEPMSEMNNGAHEVSITFQTAWGSASEGFRKVSAMFPSLMFTFDYDEEAGFFAGMEVMKGGMTIYEGTYAPCEYGEEVDWDDDSSVTKYEEWKNEQSDKIWEEFMTKFPLSPITDKV